MSRSDFNSLPYYQDLPRCAKCGAPLLEERQIVNLPLEPNYERHLQGTCRRCGSGYNFVSKIFVGADLETYHGEFDSSGEHPTRSGMLTTNRRLDPEKIIRENKATNFQLEVAVKKEGGVDNSGVDSIENSPA